MRLAQVPACCPTFAPSARRPTSFATSGLRHDGQLDASTNRLCAATTQRGGDGVVVVIRPRGGERARSSTTVDVRTCGIGSQQLPPAKSISPGSGGGGVRPRRERRRPRAARRRRSRRLV